MSKISHHKKIRKDNDFLFKIPHVKTPHLSKDLTSLANLVQKLCPNFVPYLAPSSFELKSISTKNISK